jgi:acyl-CoA synthetase (AMP-forming)/AMP-acid ligase II
MLSNHQDSLRMTFGEMMTHVNNVAGGLHLMDLKRGDTVGLWLPNDAETLICQIAASKLGVAVTPLDFTDGSFSPLIKKLGLRGMIFAHKRDDEDRIKVVQGGLPGLAKVEEGDVFRSKEFPNLRYLIQTGLLKQYAGIENLSLIQWKDPNPNPLPAIQATVQDDDAAVVLDGSTISHKQLNERGAALVKKLSLTAQDKVCLASSGGPLTTATALTACLMVGAEIVLPSKEFNAQDAATAIANEGCTVVLGTPENVAAINAAAGDSLGELRVASE